MKVLTIEQAQAKRDAAKFYAAAEQSLAAHALTGEAHYEAHADKMLSLYLGAMRHAG